MAPEVTMSRFSKGALRELDGRRTSLAIATNNGFVDFPHIVSTAANGFCPGESLENAQNLGLLPEPKHWALHWMCIANGTCTRSPYK